MSFLISRGRSYARMFGRKLNGLQTLVGVISVLPTPALPVGLLKLCLWTRWCGGFGRFRQTSRILGVEEVQIVSGIAHRL